MQVREKDLVEVLIGDHQCDHVGHRAGTDIKQELFTIACLDEPARGCLPMPRRGHTGTTGDHAHFVRRQVFGAGVIDVAVRSNAIGVFDDAACSEQGWRSRDQNEKAQNPDQEEADIELEVVYPGDDIEIGFNVNYMLDVLNITSSEMVQAALRDSNSSFLLTYPDQPDCKYVIMPMRL